jgi:hypothetical protein
MVIPGCAVTLHADVEKDFHIYPLISFLCTRKEQEIKEYAGFKNHIDPVRSALGRH